MRLPTPTKASAHARVEWSYPLSCGDLDEDKALTHDDATSFDYGEFLPCLGSLKPPAWLKDAMVVGGVDVCLKIDDNNNNQKAFSPFFEA
jgi:hypothetical protein